MKLWNALAHPAKDGTFRRAWSGFAVAVMVVYAILALTGGEDWWMWSIGIVLMLVILLIWLWVWGSRDAEYRRTAEAGTTAVSIIRHAPINTSTATEFLRQSRDMIPVTRPEDAADPFAYAMMKALESDEPVSVYRDDEGVWRDSITDAVLPVQEEDK